MVEDLKENIDELNIFLHSNNRNSVTLKNPFEKISIFKISDKIVGYVSYSIIYDKAEINDIYVLPENRNCNIGFKLMSYAITKCRNCQNITLEVKRDNDVAIKLYEKLGFNKVAVREKYYDGVDGILMLRNRGD